MIVAGTQVTVSADGHERPVQDLCIADRVFDPMSGTCDEIVDILARRVCLRSARLHRPLALLPDALAPGRPRHRVELSPAQVVMLPVGSQDGGWRKHIAESLASGMAEATPGLAGEVSYFAIFFDRPRYLDVSGIMMRAYTLEDIAHARAR